MKRTISLLLTVIMIVSVLSACTSNEPVNISSNITVASSDAESYAKWLTDRLGTVTDNVVIGMGNDNPYGVDMSDFEDDGYIIKNMGDDTLILGKAEDGLDRAVRKYANAVSLGKKVEDTVYHEGYRVEKFTLFGKDISEYTIVYSKDCNENMELAATDLQRLIKEACGADLPLVKGETDVSPLIRIEYSDKEELKIGGFEYFEQDGDLVISGAVREGCANGVYRFLENECNWNWLIYGSSDLQETDHLVIEEGLYKKEVPAFEWHRVSANRSNIVFDNDRTVANISTLTITTAQQSYPTVHANHGLTKHAWAEWIPNNHSGQLCYTTESYYYTVCENVLAYLKEHEVNGGVVGETIRDIDISQGDSGTYCQCANCTDIVMEEQAVIGPVVRFANAVAETINAEYPGADIIFKIFAYYNAFKPSEKTAPNKWVSVSYAPNGSCANHIMDGTQCDPNTVTFNGVTGVEFGQYLDDWCAISDNTYVWYYHIGDSFNYYNVWDVIYYDYKHMYDIGVKGVYFYNYDRGMGLKAVEHLLAWYLYWDIDMTWEEYESLFDTILEKEYGDGWQYMKELLSMYKEMENDNCWQCWGYSDRITGVEMYDLGYLEKNFDKMAELVEKAILLAGNATQEAMCEMFSVSLYYCGCYASFFKAYNANDTEALAKLEADYQKVIDRFTENGYDYTYIPNISHFSIGATIWEEAANEWVYSRNMFPAGESPEREYSKANVINKEIEALGEITDSESASKVFKILGDYSSLTAEQQANVTGIEDVKAALDKAVTFFEEESMKLKVMSFNIRYNELTEDRIARVIQTIKNESPDVVGLQEGMDASCEAIKAELGDEYEMLGHGRDSDKTGENCNVLYKKSEFNLLDSGTIWLSNVPEYWSIYHGSAQARIMTYQLLERISDGQVFLHANTHLDYNGSSVRVAQAKILLKYLSEKFGNKYPVIITGDFNCSEGTDEFQTILDGGFEVTNKYGESTRTYQAYGEKSSIIDFIFVNDLLPVKSYKVCDEQIDGEWVSDHNAIVSELLLYPTYDSLQTAE